MHRFRITCWTDQGPRIILLTLPNSTTRSYQWFGDLSITTIPKTHPVGTLTQELYFLSDTSSLDLLVGPKFALLCLRSLQELPLGLMDLMASPDSVKHVWSQVSPKVRTVDDNIFRSVYNLVRLGAFHHGSLEVVTCMYILQCTCDDDVRHYRYICREWLGGLVWVGPTRQ